MILTHSDPAISPLDDRYRKEVEELSPIFSEMALMNYRVRVEVEYLIALGQEKGVSNLPPFSKAQKEDLRSLYRDFTTGDFGTIKKHEEQTQHDVKAVEYFLKQKLQLVGLGSHQEWVHFALTSEDVNNLAYHLMWQDGIKQVYLPMAARLHGRLKQFAQRYGNLPMLALTHGQPATPTSLGKEFAVFTYRLGRQLEQLKRHSLHGKLSGATGTWSAHVASFPKVDWIKFTRRFVSGLKLEPTLITTQVESHDSLAESFHILCRMNTILLDFCRDMWFYISRGIFGQKARAGEVGSSTMPHKVNPIHFENAEGNLQLANSNLSLLAQLLPVSRLQRDLSGSTVIRNHGVPLAYSLLACKHILKGLDRLTVNRERIREELNDHWEVLSEAMQTILRKVGDTKPYERLKDLTRGQKMTREELHTIIQSLDLPEEEKETLLALTPETYIGLAERIVEEM